MIKNIVKENYWLKKNCDETNIVTKKCVIKERLWWQKLCYEINSVKFFFVHEKKIP